MHDIALPAGTDWADLRRLGQLSTMAAGVGRHSRGAAKSGKVPVPCGACSSSLMLADVLTRLSRRVAGSSPSAPPVSSSERRWPA